MNKKRLLAIIMTMMLIVGLLPLSTYAEEDAQEAGTATESVKEESPAFSQSGKHTPGTLRALTAASKQVKYDKNTLGSVTDMPENVEVFGATYTLSNKVPNMDHYTFEWWTTDVKGNGVHYNPGSSYTFPEGTVGVTFYAQWTADEHDVIFDPSGGQYDGKTIPTTEKHDYDETFTLTAATREHYQFMGWKANDAAGTVYQAGARYHVTGDVTFTAQWECDTIDITVNTTWKIPEGLTVDCPEVPVTLVASTDEKYSATLTEPYWVHTFEKLPAFDGGGNDITYSVGEIKLDHFDTSVGPRDGNSLNIINTYLPDTVTVNLHVIKEWEDDNKTEERPDSIQIALYADKVMISDPDNLPVLTADGGWEYDFTDLPKYKSQNGNYQEIEYKIVEVSEVADYTSSSDQSGYNWIITNTYAPQQREVTVIGGTTNDSPAFKNDTVRIKANDPAHGTFFKCWESNDIGGDAFDDATAFATAFTMPAKEVTVKAVCNKVLIGPADGTTDDTIADQTYTGSEIKPKLKVELEGVDADLIEGTDYDVKYEDNINAGDATAIVTLRGKWKGSGSIKFTITEKPVYKAVSGSGGTYTKGSGKSLTFTYKRSADDETTIDHFTGITVDGKAVPEKDASGKANWTAKSGSVIIELQSSYLETLSVGEHKLAVQFDDGADATATFTVKAKSATPANAAKTTGKNQTTTPKTGDESNMLLWFLLICASLFVMSRITSLRNRRFYDR